MPSVQDFQGLELIYAGDKFVTCKKKKRINRSGSTAAAAAAASVNWLHEETATVLLCRWLAEEKKPAAFHENTQTSDRTHKLAVMCQKYIFAIFSDLNAYFCRFPFSPLI